jgi:hypothetical protein
MLFQGYLFAWVFWMTLTTGCFGFLLLHHAVRGSWGLVVLRIFETGSKMLPIMAVAFLPIAANVAFGGHLYHWSHPEPTDTVLAWKRPFLNPVAFIGTTYLCFAIWVGWANLLIKSSLRQDRTGNENEAQLRANWGAAGLVMFVLTNTLTWTHWVMSLDPHWFSTIFPAWFLVCSGLFALAFCAIFTTTRRIQGVTPWKQVVTTKFQFDLGNLMLAFCLIWAYFSLSQFLIMYSGNLPEEITYYHNRMDDPVLSFFGTVLIFFQWLVPFVLLLAPRTKTDPRLLRNVAILIVVMRFLDIFWTVMPFFKEKGAATLNPTVIAIGFVMALGLGIAWMTLFMQQLKKESPVPTHDPRLEGVVSHV